MRKILLIIISLLLVITAYYAISKGIILGNFEISSIKSIKQKSEQLDTKIEDTNRIIDTEYPSKISSLKTATTKMDKAKQEYLDLTNISSNEQIIKATLQESYTIELLWTKVGNHAVKKGVNLDMEVIKSMEMSTMQNGKEAKGLYDLKFTVKGTYLAIINFVEAIENDSVLNFRVHSFKLLPDENSILKATFTVKNIAIEGNTSSQGIITSNTDETKENKENDDKTNKEKAEEEKIGE